MQNSIKNKAPSQPNFTRMLLFSSKLLLSRRFFALLLVLILLLLSGHLSLPEAAREYDSIKMQEAIDLQGFAMEVLQSQSSEEDKTENKADDELLAVWEKILRDSGSLVQGYSVLQRYQGERPVVLDTNWPALYEFILTALRKEYLKLDDVVILKIGIIPLMETHIYNAGRVELGLDSKELRPSYDRAQYWRNLFSGTHYLSFAPLLFLILILHNSFSMDYDSQSYKLLESLPLSATTRNIARLLAQLLLSILIVWLCLLLCGLTYPAGDQDNIYYLQQQGDLSQGYSYLQDFPNPSQYLIAFSQYCLKALPLYLNMMVFWALLSMLGSASTRNNISSFLISISILLLTSMPNYMQHKLMHLLPSTNALFSVQMIIEGKAMLSYPTVLLLVNGINLFFCLCIVFSNAVRRK